MLIRFAVANHRSVKDPVELSLVAVDDDRAAVRHFERVQAGILTLAAIYGPNASGKSNVLEALSWVCNAVRSSLRSWEETIPREPFRFEGYPSLPSVYEIDFIVNEVRHVYSLELDDEEILFEELISYPERRPRQLFVREGMNVHFRRGLRGAGGVQELLTKTTLVLSLASRFAIKEVEGPAQYISRVSTPFPRGRPDLGLRIALSNDYSRGSTRRLFLDAHRASLSPSAAHILSLSAAPRKVEMAGELLRLADLGIEDVLVVDESKERWEPGGRLDVRLLHRSNDEFLPFAMNDESVGTQMWFRLIGPTLAALRAGTPLVLDEIDASLHPLLSATLLDLFRDPRVNANNAQLIFTTHDTSLLGELNRDEVWLTEKGPDGATSLKALAEFGGDRVRKSLNLERAYLQGRFGAIPRIRESTIGNFDAEDALSTSDRDGRIEPSANGLPDDPGGEVDES